MDQPYVGTPEQRNLCQQGITCTESASSGPLTNLSDAQLDFYSCLNELDAAVGRVLDSLDKYGYGKNTLTWLGKQLFVEWRASEYRNTRMIDSIADRLISYTFCTATDNGPEEDCPPEGECTHDHYRMGPGTAVPLRGRKRDIW